MTSVFCSVIKDCIFEQLQFYKLQISAGRSFNTNRLLNLYCEISARVHMAKDAQACERVLAI